MSESTPFQTASGALSPESDVREATTERSGETDGNRAQIARPFRSGRLNWFLGAGLALLTLAVFLPAAKHGFVAWDDGHNIYQNPHLGLGGENLKWMFTNHDYVHRYLPLGWLSYSVDRAAFGGGPLSYHVGNILFHTLNTVLLFVLLRQLLKLVTSRTATAQSASAGGDTSGAPGASHALPVTAISIAAALGALWWAVNPLRVESVAWASSRLYGVAIAFMLFAILSYLRGSERGQAARGRWVGLAALFYAMSLFTYPLAMGGVALFLVLDVYPLRRLPLNPRDWLAPKARRILAEKGIFLIPGALMLAITLWTRSNNASLGTVFEANQPGVFERAMQAFYVWAYYLWKPWAPVQLAPEYPTLLEFNPWSGPFIVSAVLILGLTACFWRARKAWPALPAVWVCHLALLVPVLGIESLGHYHTADRYSYLQGMGWAVVLAGAIFAAWRFPRRRAALVVGVLAWGGFCAALIPGQIGIWKNSLTLHTRIVTSLGRNPERHTGQRVLRDRAGHETFLGQLQSEADDLVAAEASFRHAILLNPALVEPRVCLGKLLVAQNRNAEARTCLEELVRSNPEETRGRMLLAIVLGQSGNLEESAQQFQEVLRTSPRDFGAHHNLAVTLERLGQTNAARTHYARATELSAAQGRQP